jgi:hypothetical protein
MKKGDDVADDDALRNSVSKDRVTSTLSSVPQDSVYIGLSTYQTSKNVGGEGNGHQHDT